MSDEDGYNVPVHIGKTDREWFENEWEPEYATETSRGKIIKRHMRWGYELDQLFDEFGIEVEGVWDFRMRMRSALEKLAEESE